MFLVFFTFDTMKIFSHKRRFCDVFVTFGLPHFSLSVPFCPRRTNGRPGAAVRLTFLYYVLMIMIDNRSICYCLLSLLITIIITIIPTLLNVTCVCLLCIDRAVVLHASYVLLNKC